MATPEEEAMAKIHVRGGSPLKLEFTDDKNNPHPNTLELRKTGHQYFVYDTDTKKNLMAVGPFTATNPSRQHCEIEYEVRDPAGKPEATV
ncbi:MAG: hypothetical protein V3R71_06810 [Gemmatimonadales bacterium]